MFRSMRVVEDWGCDSDSLDGRGKKAIASFFRDAIAHPTPTCLLGSYCVRNSALECHGFVFKVLNE